MSKNYRTKKRDSGKLAVAARPVAPYGVALLSFFLICLCSANVIKGTGLVILLAALVLCVFRFKTLREQITLPLITLGLIVLMDMISTFYAPSGKFALSEFIKVIVAFAFVIILLVVPMAKGVDRSRRMATLLTRTAAFFSLISIDLISTRILAGPVVGILNLFGPDFYGMVGAEDGIRMTSLLGNPNVFAGIAGLGVLLGLSLVLSGDPGKERKENLVCLYMNALAFVLAFSMGATGVIAVAFVVYLILEYKDRRAGLFILMVETLIVTLLGVIPVAMTSLQKWDGFQPVPLLCLIVGAVLLCLSDHYVGRPMEKKLAGQGKKLLFAVIALVVLLGVVAAVACTMTGQADLSAGETLRRSVYPAAGDYTVSAQVSGPVSVTIESQNEQDTMMHTSTVLYQGDLSDAAFTVPADSKVVYFNFSAGQDVCLEKVAFAGAAGEGEVALGYKLLPNFIANRLQGLWANQNAVQRTVFFEDGIKLFRRSPVAGLGMGSFENAIRSVQSFLYDTKYAHNHYIQSMAETGIIGLILFVGMLLCSAWAVLRSRKSEKGHFLTPALGAALVFMAGHAGVELVFSYYAYLPFAFGVIALIGQCCAPELKLPFMGKKGRNAAAVAVVTVLAVFTVLLTGNLRAASLVRRELTFQNLEQAAKMDKYEWADHMLSYVMSAENARGIPEVQQKATKYAARLAEVDSNTIPGHLAGFYFNRGDNQRGFAMVEKYVTYVAARSEAWQDAFYMLDAYFEDTAEYRAGVKSIYDKMVAWNEENMGEITLTKDNLEFLQRMGIE